MELKGDAAKKILERLKKGPARPKQLQDDLDLPHSTLFHNLKKDSILFKLDLIEQLDDGRYVAKGVSSEETRFRESYHPLRRKLLRNPSSEELAGLIQKTPATTKALLFKYIPYYREPYEEEMASSAKTLWKMLVWGNMDLPSKKDFFKEGIENIIVEGIDQDTLNEILENKPSISLDEAKIYINEFADLNPKISSKKEDIQMRYKLEWSEEVRIILRKLDSWNQIARINIPRRFERNEGILMFGYGDPWIAIDFAEELAGVYAPSQESIEYLVSLIGLPHRENKVLVLLKLFCQNAMEIDQLDNRTKEMIISKLKDVAFFRDIRNINRDYENPDDYRKERNNAFEIIEMFDLRDESVIDLAMDYIFQDLVNPLSPELIEGPDRYKVVKWMAKDLSKRAEIENRIHEVLKNADAITPVNLCRKLLEIIT